MPKTDVAQEAVASQVSFLLSYADAMLLDHNLLYFQDLLRGLYGDTGRSFSTMF